MSTLRRKAAIGVLYFSFIVPILLINRSLGLDQPQLQQQQQQQQQLIQLQTQLKQSNGTGSSNGNNNNINNALSAMATADNFKPLIQAALAAASPKVLLSTVNQPVALSAANTSNLQLQQPQSQPQLSLTSSTSLIAYGNGDDPITYLDYSSINDEILRKRTANFVYFNANFNHCRHCHKFFTIWKELAVDIRWWRQVVRLFTINCSDEDNIDVCRRAGVTQFPQLRYYWIMSNSLEQDGQRIRILGKSVHALRHDLMNKVLDSYTEHNKFFMQRYKQQKSPSISSPNGTGSSSPAGGSNFLLALMTNPMISSLINAAGASSAPNSLSSGKSSGSSSSSSSSNFGPTNTLSSIAGLLNGAGGGGGGMNGLQAISQLMSAFMGASSNEQRLSIGPMPANWPELDQMEVTDTQQLIDMLPLDLAKGIGALLIMETQEFLYTGLEVMLDLSLYGNQTYIARVRDERSQLSKNLTKRDDIQAPALIYVTPDREPKLIMTAPKYTNDEDLRRVFVRAFERRQIKYPVRRVWPKQVAPTPLTSASGTESQEDEEIMGRIHHVYTDDLTNTLRASLMEQVFRHPDLSDDQYNALVRYVYALINYFPFNNNETLKFFKRLHSWLQNQVSPMDIGEYKKQFHDIDDVLQKREWVACKSLSNTKSIPGKSKKSSSLFENPAQLGKVVSNLTRLFRDQQKQASKLSGLFSMFTSNSSPVMLSKSPSTSLSKAPSGQNNQPPTNTSNNVAYHNTFQSSQQQQQTQMSGEQKGGTHESPIERIIKSLTNGSLGSDSSILKLISTALSSAGGRADQSRASSGRSKFAREYSCGAWKLAHVMVINEYIKDSPRKDVKHIVLHSLYQYLLNFYTCPTCGNRISDIKGEFRLNLDEHLLEQGDSVMLLWKMHNRVNKRLESELRPGSPPKAQFPNESLCAKCRAPRAQNDLVSTPIWHEKQVLNFLVHHYRPQSLMSANSSSNNNNNNNNDNNLNSSSVFDFAISSASQQFWQKRNIKQQQRIYLLDTPFVVPQLIISFFLGLLLLNGV